MDSQLKLRCRTTSISALSRTALRAHICSFPIPRQTLAVLASLASHEIFEWKRVCAARRPPFVWRGHERRDVFFPSPFSIRERNPRTIPFSSLFSFMRHEAISGLLQRRKSARRTRAGQRKREMSFSVIAAMLFSNGARADLVRRVFGVSPQHCFHCSLFVFSPRRLFSSLASEHHAEDCGSGFECGSHERARRKHASRVKEERHS